MNSKRKPYKTYPKEFKVEAVRMMRESDKPAAHKKQDQVLQSNILLLAAQDASYIEHSFKLA